MARPLIGLTTYPTNAADKFTLPAKYVHSVRRAGGEVVLLPPDAHDPVALVARLDGLVLSGGGDIDPSIYGGDSHQTVYALDEGRDRNELDLARWVLESKFPTLAICRGHQVLNVAHGGKLCAHLPDVTDGSIQHRVEPPSIDVMPDPILHAVTVESGSALAKIIGTDVTPMSWHHQAVTTPGEGMRAIAYAPDGTIEAIEADGHPHLVSVQWHPELTAADDPSQQALFDNLISTITTKDRR